MKTFKRLATAVLIAAMLFSSVMVMPAEAATRLSTPSNCRFVKWQSKTMTYAEVGWNSVSKANAYQAVISWADNTNKKYFNTSDTSITFTGLAVNRVYKVRVKALKVNSEGTITLTSPWSSAAYIIPAPPSKSVAAESIENHTVRLQWYGVSGSNGYDVYLTTNPRGNWHYSLSTSSAKSTTVILKKYRSSKFKTYQNYYYRIISKRWVNSRYINSPIPSPSYYAGYFYFY